jgi:hypothetical protein
MTQKHLPPDLAAAWASSAQFRFLDALMADPVLACDQIAFHGGTSLHFSWRSPRRSEDLDFLTVLAAEGIRPAVARAHRKAGEAFLAEDPRFILELRDKTRSGDRMIAYHLVVSHPDFLGRTLVKVEFWRVDAGYLAGYPIEFRAPVSPGDIVSRISNPVPAATLETAYCDKLTAFATRPYLKWRDIYDLWWIGTQTDARLELSAVARQFLHNVRAYDTLGGLPPAQALRRFLTTHDPEAVIRKADPDLKRWLPDGLWARLHPEVTAEMAQYVWHALERVADAIEKNVFDASLKRVSS